MSNGQVKTVKPLPYRIVTMQLIHAMYVTKISDLRMLLSGADPAMVPALQARDLFKLLPYVNKYSKTRTALAPIAYKAVLKMKKPELIDNVLKYVYGVQGLYAVDNDNWEASQTLQTEETIKPDKPNKSCKPACLPPFGHFEHDELPEQA